MGKGEVKARHAKRAGATGRAAGQDDSGRLAGTTADLDVAPPNAAAPTGSEGLHDRLFGRKASRQMLGDIFPCQRVGLFVLGEAEAEKTVAMPPADAIDAFDFNKVRADADDHAGYPSLRSFIMQDGLGRRRRCIL